MRLTYSVATIMLVSFAWSHDPQRSLPQRADAPVAAVEKTISAEQLTKWRNELGLQRIDQAKIANRQSGVIRLETPDYLVLATKDVCLAKSDGTAFVKPYCKCEVTPPAACEGGNKPRWRVEQRSAADPDCPPCPSPRPD